MNQPLPIQPLSIWTVNFYDCQWHDHARYQDDLKAVCRDMEKENKRSRVSQDAKKNLYESSFDFVKQEHPAVKSWLSWAEVQVFEAVSHANKDYWKTQDQISISFHESWCHITRDGGYHDMHIHPNSSWSGIYYLDTGNMDNKSKNGINRFYSPMLSMYTDAGTMWNHTQNSIDIHAEPGMMIIFPSWIQHSALIYHGSKERFIISFNCQIKRI